LDQLRLYLQCRPSFQLGQRRPSLRSPRRLLCLPYRHQVLSHRSNQWGPRPLYLPCHQPRLSCRWGPTLQLYLKRLYRPSLLQVLSLQSRRSTRLDLHPLFLRYPPSFLLVLMPLSFLFPPFRPLFLFHQYLLSPHPGPSLP
jgi:hypothetical protein